MNGASRGIYGPVEDRNCVMCRHFISGPPWWHELEAYGTKLCERRQFLAREEARINDQVKVHEDALRAGSITKAFFENKYASLQAEVVQVKDKQELLENSMFNIEVLCAASKKLLDEERADQEGVMLVANSASSPVGYEEISEFEQAVRITANGRIHRILGDERVEAKRDQYLNLMLWNSGFTPPTLFTRISAEQRRKAMDQYALFVQSRVPSDEVGQLVDGTLRLSDIGLEGQVRELLDVALSEPAFLAGSQSHTRSLELGAVS